MKLPRLASISAGRSTTDAFGGYNHNLRIGDGEWFDMKNMTSDFYPVMSPRGKRGAWRGAEDYIQGVVVNNGLCYVDGDLFYLPNGEAVGMGLTAGKKQMVNMGAYVIILPDKKWINVAACLDALEKDEQIPTDAYGAIEETVEFKNFTVAACNERGEAIAFTTSTTRPVDPGDGELWVDKNENPPVIKEWIHASKAWIPRKSYLRVSYTGEHKAEKGDVFAAEQISMTLQEVVPGYDPYLYVPKDPMILEVFDDGFLIEGLLDYMINNDANMLSYIEAEIPVTWKRTMPDMDLVVESGNRLWGCKFGSTDKGFLNEIYASKLGDFKNWNSFQGVSTDSYTASIGEGGPFTGAVNYGGRPYFFKENCMIEVYGAYPAQYQVQTTPCKGVQAGCEKSLAVVNNVLFYKSLGGVCAFDGSLPAVISSAFGTLNYKNAVGGGVGNKYYISMQGMDDEWNLFVYDTTKGFWHKEDDLHAVEFVGYGNELYGVSENRDEVFTVLSSDNHYEGDIEWMVQSGEIGLSLPDAKYVTRLTVRMSLEEGSEVSFFVQYDFEEEWIHLCTIPGTSLRSFDIPIRPKRCDHMKLRLEGIGGAKIYSITKTIEQGSDVM